MVGDDPTETRSNEARIEVFIPEGVSLPDDLQEALDHLASTLQQSVSLDEVVRTGCMAQYLYQGPLGEVVPPEGP
jgi:hypothetical protein